MSINTSNAILRCSGSSYHDRRETMRLCHGASRRTFKNGRPLPLFQNQTPETSPSPLFRPHTRYHLPPRLSPLPPPPCSLSHPHPYPRPCPSAETSMKFDYPSLPEDSFSHVPVAEPHRDERLFLDPPPCV